MRAQSGRERAPSAHTHRRRPPRWARVVRVVAFGLIALAASVAPPARSDAPGPLDPAARLLHGSDASESYNLYVELETGHRITQQFLITNAGPGDHSAVALGHLVEPGRAPFRYENGRREGRWTLSEDRLFFDIAASHLDLHRPEGELRITKDVIEIRVHFDFAPEDFDARVPADRLPPAYHVDVLAVGAPARARIHAPWMDDELVTQGRVWLNHTWMTREEAELLERRVDLYGHANGTSFYGLSVQREKVPATAWMASWTACGGMIESRINVPDRWRDSEGIRAGQPEPEYPLPAGFEFSRGDRTGQISLGREWLRFDPLSVIPQPFRWFIRRTSKPRQVWADASIGGTLFAAPGSPSLPHTGESESGCNSKREIETETAERSVTGVASITFLNPSDGR